MDPHTLAILEFGTVAEVLASFALTPLGRARALKILPASDAAEARRALAETGELATLLADGERMPLGAVRDSAADLAAASTFGRALEPEELWGVVELVRSARSLRERVLAAPPESTPSLRARIEPVAIPESLADRIEEAIDARGGVSDWASDRLALLRDTVRRLRELLRNQVGTIMRRSRVARCLQEEQATMRNDRFVLALKREHRDSVPGVLHGYSQTGATAYVEPQEIVVAGNEFQAAIEEARREETRILLELTRAILKERAAIELVVDCLAWADLTYAKRELMRRYEFAIPRIADDGVLSLSRARHPILLWQRQGADPREPDLDRLRREVIPLDLELGRDARLLIVTGPNTGGKTVALKTVGLIAVMAASGLPVPASPPTAVPFYREIYVDVGDEQSLEQSLSTFSSHMRQVVRVVKEAAAGDLVILDELGAGTDPLEGGALGAVVLDELRSRGAHVIASTHLGSLKEYAYTHREAANAAMTFDPVGLGPTYRMLVGAPGQSCALLVAERLGFPAELVARAQEMIAVPEPQRAVMQRMEEARLAVEGERRRAQKARRRAEQLRVTLNERIREADRAKDVARREAEEEIEAKVRRVREAIMEIVPKLRSVPGQFKPHVEALEHAVERILIMTPLGDRREEFARSLKVNDEVHVPKLGAICRVVRINKGKRRLTVRSEGIEAEIGFEDISWAPPAAGGAT